MPMTVRDRKELASDLIDAQGYCYILDEDEVQRGARAADDVRSELRRAALLLLETCRWSGTSNATTHRTACGHNAVLKYGYQFCPFCGGILEKHRADAL